MSDDDEKQAPARVYGMPDPQNRQGGTIQGMRGENPGGHGDAAELTRRVTTGDGRSFDIVETSGKIAGEIIADAERRTREAEAPAPARHSRLPGLVVGFAAGLALSALVQAIRRNRQFA